MKSQMTRINTQQLIASCQGKVDSAVLRLESFCDRGMQLIDLIEISISDENWSEVNQLAARFQLALQNIAAEPAAAIAQTVVSQSRNNECPAFRDLHSETSAVMIEIETWLGEVNGA